MVPISILALIWACLYLIKQRENAVDIFREKILDMCIDHDKRNYTEFLSSTESAFYWVYANMPSKSRMRYSVRPLELEYWFTRELIARLLK